MIDGGLRRNSIFWAQWGSCSYKFMVVVIAHTKHMQVQVRSNPNVEMGGGYETLLLVMQLLATGSCWRRGPWEASHAPVEAHTSTNT